MIGFIQGLYINLQLVIKIIHVIVNLAELSTPKHYLCAEFCNKHEMGGALELCTRVYTSYF